MLEKFIPAKMPAAIAAMIPGRQMTLDCRVVGTPNSAGPFLTSLPQIAPPAPKIGVPVPQIPKSSDIAVRITPNVPVPSPPQPNAGNIGPRYNKLPSVGIRAISTEFPVQEAMPVGGLGQNPMALLALRAGSEAMQGFGSDLSVSVSPISKVSQLAPIDRRRVYSEFVQKSPNIPNIASIISPLSFTQESSAEEETPWLMYAAYGAAGVAVLGLGYVLLSKPKARANTRRRRGAR